MPIYKSYHHRDFLFSIILLQFFFNNIAEQRIIKDAGIHNENAATMQSKEKYL